MAPVRLTVSPSLIVRVVAENHDADIVGFEVQRHAFDAAREFDHLAGLHIVEAVDARDAVADRQHLADFADFRFGAEILDFALQDGGDFGGLDIHFSVLSWRRASRSSLVRNGRIDHARAHFHDETAEKRGIDLCVEPRLAAELGFQNGFNSAVSGLKRSRAEVTSAAISPRWRATSYSNGADDVGEREQPALLGQQQDKLAREFDAPPVSSTASMPAGLLFTRKDRRTHKPRQLGTVQRAAPSAPQNRTRAAR